MQQVEPESATTPEQLVNSADYVELSRLVLEHGWRADNARADTIHELYVDNGELILPPTHLHGREAIRQWGRQLVEAPPWRKIRHACGNMRFVVDGQDEAHGTTVLTVFMVAVRKAQRRCHFRSARIMTASSARSKDGGSYRGVGKSCSRGATH